MSEKIGLIGSVTYDEITYESGSHFEGIGGVLYQAAVLCGLGKEIFLYVNLGKELVQDVERIIGQWANLNRKRIRHVSGPGNRVHLYYPQKGERIEILKSVVPPLAPDKIIEDLPGLSMLVLIINSGFDLKLKEWRKIVDSASCPLWIDIHSLPLARKLNEPREYLPLVEWKEWVEGIDYVQANSKEVASMLAHPVESPSETEVSRYAELAFHLGVKALFVTLGKEGVLVIAPDEMRKLSPQEAESVVDTTGCGDVFCGGTVVKLVDGDGPFEAASFGLQLATKAVSVKGIKETYDLVITDSVTQ